MYTIGDEARALEAADPTGRPEEGCRGIDSRAEASEAGAEEADLVFGVPIGTIRGNVFTGRQRLILGDRYPPSKT